MGYREGIRVLDATLRDGGLVNDFYFSDEFAKALYKANCDAGVDYMEVGYRASKKLFDVEKFGKWKFSNDDDILDMIGDNVDKKVKLAVMADVGRCDYKEDIHAIRKITKSFLTSLGTIIRPIAKPNLPEKK